MEGIFAAVPTPFYPDERLNLRKLEANVAHYSRSLLTGLLLLGSTGEAVALSDAEAVEVLRAAAQAAAPEKLLVAGVGQESLSRSLALAEAAASFGYDAVLARTPVYYAQQMSPEAVATYFRALADRSPIPVLLYNIPRCVPYEIPVELVAELAQHPNIIGIKDSSGSLPRIQALVEATRNAPKHSAQVTYLQQKPVTRRMQLEALSQGVRTREVGFQVLTGSCANLLESLEAGAVGATLAFAACAPSACCELFLHWKDHDLEHARTQQNRIAEASRRIGELGVAGVKHACDLNGYYGGYPRRPLLPLAESQRLELSHLLAEIHC